MAIASDPPLPAQADVLVVGAGAGGAAAAWALARHGLQVALVDAGPTFSAADYTVADDNWELTRFPTRPGSQGKYVYGPGQTLDSRWSALRALSLARHWQSTRTNRMMGTYHHVRGIGGSTLHFTGWMHRLHPHAFEMHTRFGVGADWPLKYDDLEPYYDIAERIVGVAGPPEVPFRPRRGPYPTGAHPMSRLSQVLREGARKTGLSWTQNAVAAPSRPYAGRPQCNYCGCCEWGCVLTDKGSADLTFVPAAKATGRCSVHPRQTLVELERGPHDLIKAAILADAQGNKRRLAMRHVVLAAGAIETPRLLLAMDGLANDSGQVGRNFMETLFAYMVGLHPDPVGSHRGYPEDSICWDLNAPDALPEIVGGALLAPMVASARLLGPVNYAVRLIEGFGTDHKKRLREMFGHAVGITAACENLPNSGSFIALADDSKDQNGMPLARIHSLLPDREIERLAYAREKARQVLLASGVPEILEASSSYEAFNATHVFGTCRMGHDPARSVVNGQGRSHRWQNLWIADASVFPSSGSGDGPALTIHALALRTADMIAGRTTILPD